MGMAAAQALLLIDLQAAFVSGIRAVPGAEAVLGSAKRMMSQAREARSLVAHLQNDGAAGAPTNPASRAGNFTSARFLVSRFSERPATMDSAVRIWDPSSSRTGLAGWYWPG